jgi:hypothetical protein
MTTPRSRARLELAALLLAGCATSAPKPPAVPPFALLPPASYGGSAHVTQILNAAYGEREASLQCVLDIGPQSLSVVGLTATGQRVFTLKYDGATLDAERSPFAPTEIAPERILADLELAYWPLPALQAATAGTPWTISEPRAGLRRVRYGATLVAETHRVGDGPWPPRLWLANFAYGYALDIQSQVIGP